MDTDYIKIVRSNFKYSWFDKFIETEISRGRIKSIDGDIITLSSGGYFDVSSYGINTSDEYFDINLN
jgi:hypothetical protein